MMKINILKLKLVLHFLKSLNFELYMMVNYIKLDKCFTELVEKIPDKVNYSYGSFIFEALSKVKSGSSSWNTKFDGLYELDNKLANLEFDNFRDMIEYIF